MIIGIDASRYGLSKRTGVELYSEKIIDEIVKIASTQTDHQIELYCKPEQNLEEKFSQKKGISIKKIKGKRFWTQYHLSKYLKKNKPDLLFVPSHVFPRNKGKKNIITIHDVAFISYPEVYSSRQRFYLKQTTKYACKHADKIIVPSKATRDDLIKHFKCDKSKIEVIYHGFDFNKEKKEAVKKEPLVLFVGRLETKKNLIRLVKAFSNFKKKHQEWKMVLAGPIQKNSEKILKAIQEAGLENDINTPGYISEEEKNKLIEKASIFAFVSLSEGFGFPILEAFSHKTPVLASSGSASEEVGGNAAIYVNPLDTTEIQEGLEKMAYNKSIIAELTKNMPKQLKKFDWERAAQKTWKVFTQINKS